MTVEALIALLISTQVGLAGMFVWHLFKCRDTRVDIAAIRGCIERLQTDIGNHEHGMRGQLHEHANALARNTLEIEVIKRKVDPR